MKVCASPFIPFNKENDKVFKMNLKIPKCRQEDFDTLTKEFDEFANELEEIHQTPQIEPRINITFKELKKKITEISCNNEEQAKIKAMKILTCNYCKLLEKRNHNDILTRKHCKCEIQIIFDQESGQYKSKYIKDHQNCKIDTKVPKDVIKYYVEKYIDIYTPVKNMNYSQR